APADYDYWNTDPQYPDFKFRFIMSFERFKFIKRYLHVSDPASNIDHYFAKVLPMADVVQDNSRKYYSPSSKDTYRIRGKPISEGYKIFALCDSGFTYSFLFASSREKTLLEEDFTGEQLNETQKNCGIFPPSLRGLRDQRGLRAEWGKLGGVVVNDDMVAAWVDNNIVYMLSTIHTIHKPADHVEGKLGGVVVNDVMVAAWVDNNIVYILSTIHTIHRTADLVEAPKKHPRENSNNSATRNDLFGENAVLPLKIPTIINDYNHNMNGVDIADQMRSNYATQRTHYRTWVPLFYCCLDTAIVNAYMILKLAKPTFELKNFRLSIAAAWLKEADEYDSEPDDKPERQRVVVKAGKNLPPGRLIGSHIVKYNDMSRRESLECRFNLYKENQVVVKTPRGHTPHLYRKILPLSEKQEILKFQKDNGLNDRDTAELYNVKHNCIVKWRQTISLDVKYGPNQKTLHTGRPVYTGEVDANIEHMLIEHIEELRQRDFAISGVDCAVKILQLDPDFLKHVANKKLDPENQAKRVQDWVYRFVERNGFSFRKTTHVAQNNCSLEKCIDAVSLMNRKQTAVYFDSRPNYTISEKGTSTVSIKGTSSGDQRATAFLAVTATGKKLPPMIVFKGTPGGKIEKEFKSAKYNYPDGQLYAVQEKGWTDTRIMLMWVEKILKPYLYKNMGNSPYAHLIIDSFAVHYVREVAVAIQNAGALISYIPGGGTSKIQVLDVGINKPFKNYLQSQWMAWMVEKNKVNTKKVSRVDVSGFINNSWDRVTEQTICNTWKKINFAIDPKVE
ncbi:hypothetical protein MP638_006061, partial [Amoeboaphelidium occidentale]